MRLDGRAYADHLTLSAGQARASASAHGDTDGWDMDAAWKELELARGGTAQGRKKKSSKLVLSLNGGGAPAGRRR